MLVSDAFRQQAQRNPTDFTRNRSLPLHHLIPLMLNYRKGAIQDELDQFFEVLTQRSVVSTVTPAAFCKARSKLKPQAFVLLNELLLDRAAKTLPQQRWHGFRVLAVDGSTGRLPMTPEIVRAFGRPRGSGVPLARFSRLYDVLNGTVIRADMAPYEVSERELAADYLTRLKPDDLTLYDRGYPAFWLLAYHHEEGRHSCMRVKRDFHPAVKAFLETGEKSRVVTLTPSRVSARQCEAYNLSSDPVPVRLIKVALKSGEIEVLVTSLLDEATYPTAWFGKLYQLRWGVEEHYKREKLRIEIENFSGKTPQVLLQDFHAKILSLNLATIFARAAQWLVDVRHRQRKHRYHVNFANVLSKMKNHIIRILLHTSPLDLCWSLIKKMVESVEAVRPDRSSPRNLRKVRVPGFSGNYKRTR
jgi:hypothetical protein